jgi:hypothetical protein
MHLTHGHDCGQHLLQRAASERADMTLPGPAGWLATAHSTHTHVLTSTLHYPVLSPSCPITLSNPQPSGATAHVSRVAQIRSCSALPPSHMQMHGCPALFLHPVRPHSETAVGLMTICNKLVGHHMCMHIVVCICTLRKACACDSNQDIRRAL